jgi:hypothetical protein
LEKIDYPLQNLHYLHRGKFYEIILPYHQWPCVFTIKHL